MSGEGPIQAALGKAAAHLLGMINDEGFWEGYLSSSALSTATVLSALAGAGAAEDEPLMRGGLAWLAATQNDDGGWGDTPDSPSNLSTSILVLCAMRLAGARLGFDHSSTGESVWVNRTLPQQVSSAPKNDSPGHDPAGIKIAELYDEVKQARSGREGQIWVEYRRVGTDEAARLKRHTGLDLNGYRHIVDDSSLLHIEKRHGTGETRSSQMAITRDDVMKIPEITHDYDAVKTGTAKTGLPALIYQKRYNGTIFYVEEIRAGRKKLAAKSMWKMAAGALPSAREATGSPTSETLPGKPCQGLASVPSQEGPSLEAERSRGTQPKFSIPLADDRSKVKSTKTDGISGQFSEVMARAEAYVTAHAGATPAERVRSICAIYGKDRTFAAPILMNCALAGLVPWSEVPPLPFELALCPRALYKALRLHVVSYALPALIAVGALIHRRHPSVHPVLRALRALAMKRLLGKPLASLQPASGGFLEATPLTSFVTMSLIPLAGPGHPVAARGLGFLRRSVRPDGSWPIDTNLATWVTTAAVGALARASELKLPDPERTGRWIAGLQWRKVHPFTGAAPGGFAWTHLSGGVPDADDTAGAILALARLGLREPLRPAAEWLLSLQNSDGGWPTFCRGWGKLPFDQSAPDLTAHVLRALLALAPDERPKRVVKALRRGFRYLAATQRDDGAWIPLWFGNQHAPRHENPVLGTARALLAWAVGNPNAAEEKKGLHYLMRAQNPDGGWGGAPGVNSTMEETALAVTALASFPGQSAVCDALLAGVRYLLNRIENGTWTQPAPIGLYFASLWYSEAMYPVAWTVEALGAALDFLRKESNPRAETTFFCFK